MIVREIVFDNKLLMMMRFSLEQAYIGGFSFVQAYLGGFFFGSSLSKRKLFEDKL